MATSKKPVPAQPVRRPPQPADLGAGSNPAFKIPAPRKVRG